jgi:acetyltransferase
MNDKNSTMKCLFKPRSIAIIGVSSTSTKIGYKLLNNILTSGYQGNIYPVNPKGGTILGRKVMKDLDEVPEPVDVAVIAVPARKVMKTLENCARNRVKIVSIISSGFSEIGNLEEERSITNFAREAGIRILGPNIFGHYTAEASLNATFGPSKIQEGNVAIITQSGALGVAMIGKTSVQNIGLSAIVSVGNKADIDESDLLEYLIDNDRTKIVLMYIEGIQRGERLVQVLRYATTVKPVVVIKSGRSKRGAIAAASHTGSLAGADEIFDSIMRQCGVFRAENIQDALNWCKFLSTSPVTKGENTLIVTNGGGVGVLATDAAEKYGVKLFDDTKHLNKMFKSVTHGFGSTKNPIDLTGNATGEDYINALNTALNDDNIDSVIGLYCETAMMTSKQLSDMVNKAYFKYLEKGKPIIFSIFGGELTEKSITNMSRKNIPVYKDVYEAVSCLGILHAQFRARMVEPEIIDPENSIDLKEINSILRRTREEGRHFLLAHEGHALLKAADLHSPRSETARSISEAVELAEDIGYPLVMKVVSRDILHKSDVGGVLLNLENQQEIMDAYQTIIHKCKAYKNDARIDGIELVEQVNPGMEVIIGGRRDKVFGPIMMFGLGGIYVEVMKDVSFRALPIGQREARLMIKEIKSYPLLLGVRGEPRRDIEKIVEVIIKVGTILEHNQHISDIEINPLMVYQQGQGVKAVDTRVIIDGKEKGII